MNKKWVKLKKKEALKNYEKKKSPFIKVILNNFPYLERKDIEEFLNICIENDYDNTSAYLLRFIRDKIINTFKNETDDFISHKKLEASTCIFKIVNEQKDFFDALEETKKTWEEYLDSKPVEFDGDIIITDPCYIMIDEDIDYSTCPNHNNYHKYLHEKDYPDFEKSKGSKIYQEEEKKYDEAYKKWISKNRTDWDICDYGYELEVFNIYHYMTRDTLYGDWSCTTYNTDTNKEIGQFCADAGLVSVIALDEVLKYNKDFDYHITRPWTTTLIKDFKGTVQFVVEEKIGFYEEDSEYWKKGDKWIEYSVKIVGHGINKTTQEPINFIGKQTSF